MDRRQWVARSPSPSYHVQYLRATAGVTVTITGYGWRLAPTYAFCTRERSTHCANNPFTESQLPCAIPRSYSRRHCYNYRIWWVGGSRGTTGATVTLTGHMPGEIGSYNRWPRYCLSQWKIPEPVGGEAIDTMASPSGRNRSNLPITHWDFDSCV